MDLCINLFIGYIREKWYIVISPSGDYVRHCCFDLVASYMILRYCFELKEELETESSSTIYRKCVSVSPAKAN